jgi:hypothetical protein
MSRILIIILTYHLHKSIYLNLAIFFWPLGTLHIVMCNPNCLVWAQTFPLALCCRTELDIKANKWILQKRIMNSRSHRAVRLLLTDTRHEARGNTCFGLSGLPVPFLSMGACSWALGQWHFCKWPPAWTSAVLSVVVVTHLWRSGGSKLQTAGSRADISMDRFHCVFNDTLSTALECLITGREYMNREW